MARDRAQHLRCSLRCYVREANERTTGWISYGVASFYLTMRAPCGLGTSGFVALALLLRLIVAPIGGKRRKEPRSPATSMLIVYHLCERSERADNKMDKKLNNILSLHGVRRTRQLALGLRPYSKSINVREAGNFK